MLVQDPRDFPFRMGVLSCQVRILVRLFVRPVWFSVDIYWHSVPATENFNRTKLWSPESSQSSHTISVSRVSTYRVMHIKATA